MLKCISLIVWIFTFSCENIYVEFGLNDSIEFLCELWATFCRISSWIPQNFKSSTKNTKKELCPMSSIRSTTLYIPQVDVGNKLNIRETCTSFRTWPWYLLNVAPAQQWLRVICDHFIRDRTTVVDEVSYQAFAMKFYRKSPDRN